MQFYINKRSLVITLVLCLCHLSVAQDRIPAPATESSAGPRKVLLLDADWKFIREDVPGADKPDVDDSKWQDVGLPHCYNDQDTFDKIAQQSDGKGDKNEPGVYTTNSGDGGWGGKTWYRKRFKLDSADKGKSAYLEIEAARTVAQVWLNGKFLGKYVSGFSSFAFDITQNLLPEGDNVLAIQVDDTEGADICAGNWSHWQPVLGGLYRNVRLHLTDPLHVTLPYYSFLKTEGVYFGVTNLTPLQANFRMTTEVTNGYDQETECEVTQEIVDADGTTALKLTGSQKIAAHGIYKFDQSGIIPKPHKWSVDEPYLYQVVTTVQKEGKIVDRITTPMGVRTIGFNHTKRTFLLNGKPLLLTGFGQKPDEAWPGLGSALPDWLIENDIKLMKDANGNIVRWGHCAGPVAALNAGDRIGYMNWQPNLSGESDYKGEVWENKINVLRDLVIRDRNHPSLVIWEGNNRDLSLDHTKEIRDVVNQWDWISPRPCAERGPYPPEVVPYQSFSMGMNGADYIKTLCGIESEYYRPESPRRAWDVDNDLYPPPPVQNSYFKTQQEASREFLKKWVDIASRGGGVKWHLTDDTTHMRLPGYAVTRLTGPMDATRLPKDMYGALRVIFASESQPDIHLMGHWNYEEKKVHSVDVYSTCDTVELFVNGTSLGQKTPEDRLASWDNVPFAPGKLKAVGYNGGSPDATDERVTAGPPARLKLECLTNPKGMRADRSDVAIITATVTDKEGNPHPLAKPPITFSVSGPGNYRGGFNDYLAGTTGKPTLFAEAGKIRISVRSTNQTGKVTVTATSDGLEPASISFDVLPVANE